MISEEIESKDLRPGSVMGDLCLESGELWNPWDLSFPQIEVNGKRKTVSVAPSCHTLLWFYDKISLNNEILFYLSPKSYTLRYLVSFLITRM